jgi:membrane-associated phospholipid phosphatase
MVKKQNFIIKTIHEIIEDSFKQISSLGSYQFYIIIVVIFFISQKSSEFIFLTLGFLLIKFITVPIRYFDYKDRPEPEKYNNFFEKVTSASFPSLHSARVIFLMLFLISFFNYKLFMTIFLTIISLLVLYSRIYRKRHYPIDVLVGTIIGIIVYFILKILI